MSGITTHVLDVSMGRPANDVRVVLERQMPDGEWKLLGTQATDSDGRARELVGEDVSVTAGVHRLTFDVENYFIGRNVESFYREIAICFIVHDAAQHFHVPLLLSPFGYSTYRGS